MVFSFQLSEQSFSFDSSKAIDLTLPFIPNGLNANCYYADQPKASVISMGDFVGSVALGGTVNYQKITFTPHGNGTHTECLGHITDNPSHTIDKAISDSLVPAYLVSVEPELIGEDLVIGLKTIQELNLENKGAKALIIRTLPNTDKEFKQYSNTNPPYLAPEIGAYLAEIGIEHLVVDLPSVDKEVDGGLLQVHNGFWQTGGEVRTNATITELAFIPTESEDGLYILQLGIPRWVSDAAPSRLLLYSLEVMA